jgi:hypothetical protein
VHEDHQDTHEHDHDGHDHDGHDHDEHGHGEHGHHHGDEHEHHHDHGENGDRTGFTGKVNGLIYDRLGDFDGFLLDTDDGEHAFDVREPAIEQIISRAWTERIVTTVYVDAHEPWRPARIVLRA